MPRTLAEGLTNASNQYGTSSAQVNATIMNRLNAVAKMKQLELMTGAQGNGNYIYTPPGFTNLAAEKAKKTAQIQAENEANQSQLGGALPPEAGIDRPDSQAGIPQGAQFNPYSGQPMQRPPLGMPSRQPLGIPPRTLGLQPGQSSSGIPLVKTEVAGGKSTYKQDPVALKGAESQIGVTQNAQEDINKQKIANAQSSGEMEGMIKNLVANLKSTNIEQGGAGPVRGMVGNALSALGQSHTGNIFGLKGTLRDSSVKIAQRLSGGNRGAQGIMEKVLEGIPTNSNSEEAQASSLHDFYLTSKALEKATRTLGVDKISQMSPEEFQQSLAQNGLTPEESSALSQNFSKMLSETQPRAEFHMDGTSNPPKTNRIMKMFSGKNSSGSGNDIVMMTAPDGSKAPVHKSRIEEARKDGLK